ncbi:GNAT family N-acetyltransferase [Vibrio sp. JC009]|uniref:GNAT family N-acetyltransferase n=1 Tax=Vibrio sp. JC009 TaxID=2912314 RepID=UPI0023AF4AE2|nr:GNAT family N-acetyltransferase [Vibrio sp. JC009]WED20564.1 GNAT family N-acetyltransferase [Vibrio sp. JC009]
MITIRKAKLKDYSILMDMKVSEEQRNFVTGFSELYQNRTPDHDFFVINNGSELLGFFLIDKAYSKEYTFTQQRELGLRNFMIDEKHQRKGYAVEALKKLLNYLYGAYSDYRSICLTVNKKNEAAYNCYLKAGFKDTGDIYRGGDFGPQHILRKRLDSFS